MLKKIIPVLFRLTKTLVCCVAITICARLPIARASDKLLLDKVIATVNQEIILYSDLEEAYKQQFYSEVVDESKKIRLLRDLVVHKMLLAKAKLDDLKVPKAYLERECDAKIASWIEKFGSEEKLLQESKDKSIYHIKKKLKKQLKEQYLIMSTYRHLTQHVALTPAEVKSYFNALPPDHLPYYPTSGEVYELIVYPKAVKPTEQEIKLVEIELNKISVQIVSGTLKFEAVVQQYAEDKKIAVQARLITHNQQDELLSAGIRIPFEHLHPEVYFAIERLNVGEVSQPEKYIDTLGRSAWRLYYLKQKVEAHPMNLTQDYEQIHAHFLEQKRKAVLDKWMQRAKSEFVINFAPEYRAVEELL
ncbi:PpiC-type peptidyl-prolyl cis-trans isomerase [Cardinium endosymbiont cBtQ1 of Bemisia tabaci]|nr:PpiC-type peptidyl-prolyl cis-trans isomerase [Cardinium endosymbiont cBtQ1 of Bemisia tabaci]